MSKKTKEIITINGNFWLNEQDPYEPTGIMCENANGVGVTVDLAKVLEEQFGLTPCDDSQNKVTLSITIKREK